MQENEHNSDSERGRETWERELLTRLAMSSLNEQRRARRWRIFFQLLLVIYLAIFLLLLARPNWENENNETPHTAVVEINGVIAADSEANAGDVINNLQAAFEHENTVGVIMRINSPGGSPVQAGYIYDEMLRLREQYPNIPLYAVIEDIGASGGYYIAAGAEKIYADRASIVGSIGVRMDSFGFVDALAKLGIERRLMTAGNNKGLLDPFLPENELEKQHVQQILNTIHQQFIDAVVRQRGERLSKDPAVFSGLIWAGEKSVSMGLVDELGDIYYVARDVLGEDNIRTFKAPKDVFERLFEGMGAVMLRILEDDLSLRLR